MPTGACGINCDVCRLNLLGICSTCGAGLSEDGAKKMIAQQRILGAPCPILECAKDRKIDYCTRDCNAFPCDRFQNGPYPFSQGFLDMQDRRRKEAPPLKSPSGYDVEVPAQHWQDLQSKDLAIICQNALVEKDSPHRLLVSFLGEIIRVNIKQRNLHRQIYGNWEQLNHPLVELVCLVYLIHAGPQSLDQRMVGVNELKTAHFFTGPHILKTQPLLERYGHNLDGFTKAAEGLGGESLDLADAAFRFQALPKVPLYYLLWEGDEEFQPRLSVLFDRSVEHHLTADTIWGLVTLVSDALLIGNTSN